jgi:hypothetical protein
MVAFRAQSLPFIRAKILFPLYLASQKSPMGTGNPEM